MNNKSWILKLLSAAVITLILFPGCSIKKMAMNQVANALTGEGSGTVFTGDNDPELVADALPFTIKMYESLMTSLPRHRGLRLQTGSLYIMYANAFLQTPADMLTDAEMTQQEFLLKRAKNLYLRGRDILLDELEFQYPGFRKQLTEKKYTEALGQLKKEDSPFMYWSAAGWLAAYALEPLDMKLGMTAPHAGEIMKRLLALDPQFGNGAIYEFFVLYYGAMPEYMGGSASKAREFYKTAIEASKGKSTSAHLSLATTVSVNEQNIEEFKTLLNNVLAFDPDSDPQNRLLNTINQRKARWLLDHIGDLFLETNDETTQEEEKE